MYKVMQRSLTGDKVYLRPYETSKEQLLKARGYTLRGYTLNDYSRWNNR